VGETPVILAAAVGRVAFPVEVELDIIGYRVASLRVEVPTLDPVGIALLLIALGPTAYWRLRAAPSIP
jgi:hypothetical protein